MVNFAGAAVQHECFTNIVSQLPSAVIPTRRCPEGLDKSVQARERDRYRAPQQPQLEQYGSLGVHGSLT